jgi:HK97 family phage prohead protease
MGDKNKTLPIIGERELRSFGMLDIDAQDDGSTIEGHAAVYDQKTSIGGWFDEVIERGAFDECNFDDVLFTANHGMEKIPLARSRRNNKSSTLQLATDEKGLKIRASLDRENNADARALHSAVSRGDIDGMSMIMVVGEERWEDLDTNKPTRFVQKVKRIWDVSAVNFPAYRGTDIDARGQAALDNAARVLESARLTVETEKRSADQLEIERLRHQILTK